MSRHWNKLRSLTTHYSTTSSEGVNEAHLSLPQRFNCSTVLLSNDSNFQSMLFIFLYSIFDLLSLLLMPCCTPISLSLANHASPQQHEYFFWFGLWRSSPPQQHINIRKMIFGKKEIISIYIYI